MTQTTSNCITSLYQSVVEVSYQALGTKLSIDYPETHKKSFEQTLKIVDTLGLPLTDDIIQSERRFLEAEIEKRYPGQLEALTKKLDKLITSEIFPVEVIKKYKSK